MNLTQAEITDIVQGKSGDWKKVQAVASTIWVPTTIGEKLIQLWGGKNGRNTSQDQG